VVPTEFWRQVVTADWTAGRMYCTPQNTLEDVQADRWGPIRWSLYSTILTVLYCMYVVLDVNEIFDSNDTTWKVILAIGKTSILNYSCGMKINIVVRSILSYPLVYPLSSFISKTRSILAMPTELIAVLSSA
jgi:hypothetical protein